MSSSLKQINILVPKFLIIILMLTTYQKHGMSDECLPCDQLKDSLTVQLRVKNPKQKQDDDISYKFNE